MHPRLGQSGKLWPFHADVRSSSVNLNRRGHTSVREYLGQLSACGFVECNVRYQTSAEKCRDTILCPVDELIRHQKFSWSQILFKRAYSADGNNSLHAQQFHRVNIRAKINFAR